MNVGPDNGVKEKAHGQKLLGDEVQKWREIRYDKRSEVKGQQGRQEVRNKEGDEEGKEEERGEGARRNEVVAVSMGIISVKNEKQLWLRCVRVIRASMGADKPLCGRKPQSIQAYMETCACVCVRGGHAQSKCVQKCR